MPHPEDPTPRETVSPGDVIFAALGTMGEPAPKRLVVERVVHESRGSGNEDRLSPHTSIVGRDADGILWGVPWGRCTKLHDSRDLNAETMRRLHEEATERAAALRIALGRIIRAVDEGHSVDAAIDAAREALS